MFRSNSNLAIQRDSFLQSLIDYTCSSSQKNNSRTAIATLLALNFLESSIRYSTGQSTGRAPLLKTMISEIPDAELRTLAQLLLLPTGLNLRNLLWYVMYCFGSIVLVAFPQCEDSFFKGMVLYLICHGTGLQLWLCSPELFTMAILCPSIALWMTWTCQLSLVLSL